MPPIDPIRARLSRRQALAASLAALGAAALPLTAGLARAAAGAEDPPASGPYGPFKMGIQSYSLRNFKVDQALAMTKELGLHYWESYPAHIPADAARAAESKALTAASGVTVNGFGVIAFTADHDANRKIFDFGKALGVGYFSADPAPDAFDSLDKCCAEYGIGVGIHNHGPGHRYATIESIQEAIKGHHAKIGCCVDTGHFLRSKIDPVDAVEAFDQRIFGVHLKDVKDATTFTVLGEGDLRIADLLKALAARKYSYALALEYEESPEAPMPDIRKCLDATRAAVRKA